MKKSPAVVSISYKLVNIIWFISLAAAILYAFYFLLFFFISADIGKMPFYSNTVPLNYSIEQIGTAIEGSEYMTQVSLQSVSGGAVLSTDNFILNMSGFLGTAMILSLSIFIVFHLRKLIKNVLEKKHFSKDSLRRSKAIAYSVIAYEILSSFFAWFMTNILQNQITIPGITLTPVFNLHFTPIILAFLIFVLAEIFAAGLSLQEEKDLTI
jgi:hypothetical protein